MAERPLFGTSDPGVFFRLPMAALTARRTLSVNTGRRDDAGLDPAAEPDVDPGAVARVFAETPADHVAIVFHTSGSTGQPKPVPHGWGHPAGDAGAIASSVGMKPGMALTTVLTEPMDHMFGFSCGFMPTNVVGFARPTARVVGPRSLKEALEAAETPVVPVATPTHLRSCADSTIARHPCDAGHDRIDLRVVAGSLVPVRADDDLVSGKHQRSAWFSSPETFGGGTSIRHMALASPAPSCNTTVVTRREARSARFSRRDVSAGGFYQVN